MNFKFYGVLIIFILLLNSGTAQILEGNWQGIITQSSVEGSLSNSYAYWLELKMNGDSISGRSRIEVSNTSKYGIVLIKGVVQNGRVKYSGYKIKEGNVAQFGVRWCLIIANLRYYSEQKSLSGTWRGSESCGNGKITLFKTQLSFNDNKSQVNEYITLGEFNEEISNNSFIRQKKLVVENIQFETNKYDLSNESKTELNGLVTALKKNTALQITILGHTDNIGSTSDNLILSIKRAEAVSDYIISSGISKNRCNFQGFGESRPLGDNSTDIGRKKNRRIEIEIN